MIAHKFLAVAAMAAIVLAGCAKPRPAVRPAISQSVVMVQRQDAESGNAGLIDIYIDNGKVIAGLDDFKSASAIVNNGVHVIHAICPKSESASLNFTANSGTVSFLAAYRKGGFLFGSASCRLERMTVNDDTGYMTNEKMQQGYNKQENAKPQQAHDPYAEIEKLANLKEKGVITEEEFQAQKKKILGN